MLIHKHFIANLQVAEPPRDAEELEAFISFLIKRVNMKIAKADTLPKNPMAYYCPILGNEGATGVGILETSHTVVHAWDGTHPFKMHVDLYSCSDFDIQKVLTLYDCFDIIEGNYYVFDRGDQITIAETGTIGESGTIIGRIEYGADKTETGTSR